MNQTQLVLIIVAILAVAAVVLIYLKRQKTKRLRAQFGPEYNRAIEGSGSAVGEKQLEKLQKRVEKFNIRPLEESSRARFAEAWRRLQARFVDEPERAVSEADQLVSEAMTVRGYPVDDFEQQAADLSVHHPLVIEHYRAGHAIALRHKQGKASTEDLRQALIHYRELFDELVGTPAERAQARAAGS